METTQKIELRLLKKTHLLKHVLWWLS
jgi:hypothetical protein